MGFPQIGTLLNGGLVNGLPFFTQPSGPGTLVFPQQPKIFPAQFQGYVQWPMAYPAMYYPGCGHAINLYEIFFQYNPSAGEVYAIIACPYCSFVQQVMPETQYYNYLQTPLIVS